MVAPVHPSESSAPPRYAPWWRALSMRALTHRHVRLDAGTERAFRGWYAHRVRSSVRAAIWLPVLIVAAAACGGGPFADLRATWFAQNHSQWIDAIRFGLVLPWALVVLGVVYSPLYRRWYAPVAQVFAPIHGLCIVAFDVMARAQGYSFSSWTVLTILAGYFMYGMLLRDALRTVLIVLTGYVAAGYAADIIRLQWWTDFSALVFGAAFGGYICYWLQQSMRINYLDWCRLADRVHRDPLTGIHNRRMFDEQLQRLWNQAQREYCSLGVLIIDIDHFKGYNDTLGHQAGDECLTHIARILSAGARRPLDVAVRYGGEEFAILLYAVDRPTMEALAEQLRADVLAAGIVHPASPVHANVTVSIGGACVLPRPGRSSFGLIQLADEALYAAKERGRNRTVIMDREYDSLTTGVFRSYKPHKEVAA